MCHWDGGPVDRKWPLTFQPALCCSKVASKKAAAGRGKKKLPAVSYSAARLQEKGVLLEIQDLPSTQ